MCSFCTTLFALLRLEWREIWRQGGISCWLPMSIRSLFAGSVYGMVYYVLIFLTREESDKLVALQSVVGILLLSDLSGRLLLESGANVPVIKLLVAGLSKTELVWYLYVRSFVNFFNIVALVGMLFLYQEVFDLLRGKAVRIFMLHACILTALQMLVLLIRSLGSKSVKNVLLLSVLLAGVICLVLLLAPDNIRLGNLLEIHYWGMLLVLIGCIGLFFRVVQYLLCTYILYE